MKIFLDENLSEYVADAMNSLSKGYFPDVVVTSTKREFGKGKRDEDIIPGIGNQRGILITRDINIHNTTSQFELCKEHDLGMFFLKLPKGSDKGWDLVKMIVNHWDEIIDTIKISRRPFAFLITLRGKLKRM